MSGSSTEARSAILFSSVAESFVEIQIPRRALFKAAEVCDLVKVQPYVLRSWEAEFPALGVSKSEGGPRIYRRSDVEQVLRIKHLLLDEGLTLAGARRRLEEDEAPVAADEPAIDELFGRNARERLTAVKRGLKAILELLSAGNGGRVVSLAPTTRTGPPPRRGSVGRARPARSSERRARGARRKRSS